MANRGSTARDACLRLALKHPIKQQQNHGADDRHNPARWLSGFVPADGLADVSGNERASDAEQNCDDKTTRIFSRHQQLRDCANDKADKKSRENSHSETRFIGLIRAQQGNSSGSKQSILWPRACGAYFLRNGAIDGPRGRGYNWITCAE